MTGQADTAPAPAAAPATAPTAPAAPAPAPAPAASEPASWLAGAPEDITAFVQNKGWKDPATAIESYRQLEKHMGTPADKLLRLPDFDKAEKASLDDFYGKLGRPGTPDKYELKLPENANDVQKSSLDFLKGQFHEAGLSQRQAAKVAEALWQNESRLKESVNALRQSKFAEAEAALKAEWGAAYEKNQVVAKNAAEALGLDEADVGVLKSILGPKAVQFLHNVGARMGEDQFVGEGSNGFGTMSPAQAREEIRRLQGDSEFTAKYLAGNVEARARMDQLHRYLAAGG